MNTRGFYVGALLSAAWLLGPLTGCSGGTSSPTLLPGASGSAVRSFAAQPNHKKSWMNPAAISQKLLYVSDPSTGDVEVYSYPAMTLAGVLTGFNGPLGECTDRAGNIWITTEGGPSGDTVYEYAHGGTSPVNLLTFTSAFIPFSCAINPKTGDLAISSFGTEVSVAIFHNAQGTPTMYSDANFFNTNFLGYDPSGNLYVDGTNSSDGFVYAELPAGSSTFVDITLNTTPAQPGNVQWDGKYIAIGDQGSTIYQTQGATVVSTTTLPTACLQQFYIFPQKKKVVAPDRCNVSADVYHYPAGGAPVKTVTGGLQQPFGAVLSL
ncbi:MAG: hypothetical protein WB615_12480 [Candidatus Tumulicola sp.]